MSLLKPHRGPAPLEQEPAFVDAQGIAEYEVEAILAHRQAGRHGMGALEYLIRWQGFDTLEDTWEPAGNRVNAK